MNRKQLFILLGLVIVLGGAHDLSAVVKELAPAVNYVRVTTRTYRKASEER